MSLDSKFYNEDVKTVSEITFNILTEKEIKKMSAVKNDPFGINVPDSYDNYEPKKGGLVDLRLGTCDPYLPCSTCGLDMMECPGHFGHTELADPVFIFGFLNHLKSLMQCICLRCSSVLVEDVNEYLIKIKNLSTKKRFKKIKETTKNVNFCYKCGAPVPKIKKEIKENSGSIRILLEKEVGNVLIDEKTGESTEVKKKIKEYKSPRDIYNILRNLSETDSYILGFGPSARPENLIMTRFPIPPVCIRPTGKIDFMSSSTMEDSLTLKIADIIKSNLRVRTRKDKQVTGTDLSSLNNSDFNTLLQYHIATFYDNDSASLPKTEFKTGNKPTKSISDRIKSKGGRVRSNLMGKRVDFSARSVITSDPYIDIDQVGVPLKVATNMTVPEEVTPYNIKHLSNLVKNGPFKHPGANYIYRKTYINGKKVNRKFDLKYGNKTHATKLAYGDIVQRHVVDDDYVLFNRQPTLHKPSMMGHRIHVINRNDCNTFRMSVSVCGPYGADFDGDEMNIHLAQSVQARNELARITNVKYQIIGAKSSNPIIGCIQDAVSGAYLLTDSSIKINYGDVCNLLCNTSFKDYNKIKNKIYDGKEIFSNIIPNGINSSKGNFFEIRNGNLLKGRLDKSQLSTKKNSIIHYIWDKYGPNTTKHFIDDSQRLILNFLMLNGMTIGFGDVVIPEKLTDKIHEYMRTKLVEVSYQITEAENDQSKINPDLVELSIQTELSALGANIGKMIYDQLDNTNNFYNLVVSGAKGNPSNIQKAMGCLGQLNTDGARIAKKVNKRVLPHFHKDDDTPDARGFVNTNYLNGLKGHHYFFDAIVGRNGLIDTAIKTATTGYISRKLIKGLEDLSVRYDGTVRLASGKVIQYIYGENGINQLTQTEVKLNIINYSNKDIEEKLAFTNSDMKKLKKLKIKNLESDNKKYIKKAIELRDYLRNIIFRFNYDYKFLEDKFMLPVNLFRITQEYSNKKEKIELIPSDILKGIEDILNDINFKLLTLNDNNNKLFKEDEYNFKRMYEISLYEYLSPKRCIFEYGLSKDEFKNLCDDIKLSFVKALVEPGEMIGVIAAQSLGEPTQQMTLDSKHSAGASKTATGGVPRITELLHYSKSITSPQTTIYFEDSISDDNNYVSQISSYLKHLTIRDLIDSAEILYIVSEDDEIGKLLKEDNTSGPFWKNNEETSIENLPLVIRLKLNIEKMMDKNTTLLDIKTMFISYWYNNFTNLKSVKRNIKDVISSIDKLVMLSNSNNIVHVRFDMLKFNYTMLTDFLSIVLDDITLKGINNIDESSVIKENKIIFDDKTGEVKKKLNNIIITSGINFDDLYMLKNIDIAKTRCNDIQTVYKYFGIEAARQILYYEFVTAYKQAGKLNHNHLAVLVDMMTHTGNITAIDRHGLGKLDSGPLTKASFERTMDHFIDAALYSETDDLKSVSSRIIVGRVIPGGTGCFDLTLDTELLENSEYTTDESGGRISFIPLEKDSILGDILKYGINDTDFYIPN